jgi:hypothetical protein
MRCHTRDYQGIHYGHKLHPDKPFESVDVEHESPYYSRHLNNLIGEGEGEECTVSWMRPINECRCDERLKAKTEGSTLLVYTW